MFAGFTGTVIFGLALSGWYLGNRIVAADAINNMAATPVQSSAPAQPAAPEPLFDTTPGPPELYLEIAALGSARDAAYVEKLQSQGMTAFIEVNPSTAAQCILIGPYSNAGERRRALAKLDAMGVLAVETTR